RERDLATRAHSLEAGARIERTKNEEKAAKPQEIRERNGVARERHERAAAIERYDCGRQQRRRDDGERSEAKDPRRGRAVHPALARQLPQVGVPLPPRRRELAG